MMARLRAVTPIWTGDHVQRNSGLQPTSLLGSIRWWSEALIRSYGAKACDPTSPGRCQSIDDLCATCRLFGHAGVRDHKGHTVPQAAQFAFRMWHGDGTTRRLRTEPMTEGALADLSEFTLEFFFYRTPEPYAVPMLQAAIALIARYGSLGGKTTLKPGIGKNATAPRHDDYGIVELLGFDVLSTVPLDEGLGQLPRRALQDGLPDIDLFFFVPGVVFYVHPQDGKPFMNAVLGLNDCHRPGPPSLAPINRIEPEGFRAVRVELRGEPREKSKRFFSFQKPARTWGYVLNPRLKDSVEPLLRTQPIGAAAVLWGSDVKRNVLSEG